jgi:hypothetical protein
MRYGAGRELRVISYMLRHILVGEVFCRTIKSGKKKERKLINK